MIIIRTETIALQRTEPTKVVTVQFEMDGESPDDYSVIGTAVDEYLGRALKAHVDAAVEVLAKLDPIERAKAIEEITKPRVAVEEEVEGIK